MSKRLNFKSSMQRFLQQIVMNKRFRNSEKMSQIRAGVFKKNVKTRSTPTHCDSAKWRHRAEGYANNQKKQFQQSFANKIVQKKRAIKLTNGC